MLKRVIGRLQVAAVVTLFVLSVCVGVFPESASASGATGFTGPSNLTGGMGQAISLAGLQVQGPAGDTTSVQLRVTHGQLHLASTTGLTVNGSNPAAVLSFSGTIANINTALGSLTYTRTGSTGTDTLEAATVGEGQVYFPANGHIYEFVYVGDPGNSTGIDWTDALTAANAQTTQGLNGYLTTITSQQENDYVAERLEGAGWMGASDAATEDDWKWVDGPENGTSFWSGGISGTPVSGRYNNWNGGEPNNAGDEDCAQFLSGSGGEWNDLPCVGGQLEGYVVEFGEDGSLPTVVTKSVAIEVVPEVETAASCADLIAIGQDNNNDHDTIRLTADIDCLGADVDPLFFNNGFYGIFDGQGHTIRNFNIDGINNTYSQDGSGALIIQTEGATIKNLHLEGGTVSGYSYVGALVADAYDTDIENVTSAMTVTGLGGAVGGLVGYYSVEESERVFQKSSSTGPVSGASGVGGLIGQMFNGGNGIAIVKQVFATGDVTASSEMAGGLLGEVYAEGWDDPESQGYVQDAYAQGDVTINGGGMAGGLIGNVEVYEDGSPTIVTIRRVYASGNVTADYKAGGLIGSLASPGDSDVGLVVKQAFAAGVVNGGVSGTGGGLLGDFADNGHPLTWDEMYYDLSRTGQPDCSVQGTPGTCLTRNTDGSGASYFYRKTNAPMTAWDFSTIWAAHTDTYPTFSPDDDMDGISAAVEQAAPNGGDANADGIDDDQQPNVSSFVNAVTNKYVTLAVSDACSTTQASTASEASKSVQDSGYDYPAGLLGFTSECGSNGFTATITQYFYGLPAGGLLARKYNPNTNGYFMVPDAAVTAVTIGGQAATKVVYQVTDGGVLDLDGTANGTIVDPAGPASSTIDAPDTGVRSWQSVLFKR